MESRKKRVRLTVAYDGTAYHGWQVQPGVVTIESKLNECLSQLLKEKIEVIGASRTDSGVHALGNIAVFDTFARMPAGKISYALNQRLPDDIKIKFKSATAIRKHLGIMEGGRVLGFYNSKKHEIWIERNGPEACVMSTVLHELTHAWQYANLDFSNPKLTLAFIEGHSTYVEIEGMYERKQARYASFLDRITMARDDEYGIGYRFWKDYISAESDKNIFNHMKNLFGK